MLISNKVEINERKAHKELHKHLVSLIFKAAVDVYQDSYCAAGWAGASIIKATFGDMKRKLGGR